MIYYSRNISEWKFFCEEVLSCVLFYNQACKTLFGGSTHGVVRAEAEVCTVCRVRQCLIVLLSAFLSGLWSNTWDYLSGRNVSSSSTLTHCDESTWMLFTSVCLSPDSVSPSEYKSHELDLSLFSQYNFYSITFSYSFTF